MKKTQKTKDAATSTAASVLLLMFDGDALLGVVEEYTYRTPTEH